MTCATATIAGAFRPPGLLVRRQNLSRRKQFFVAAAAHAHSVSAPRSQGFPPVVWLLFCRPGQFRFRFNCSMTQSGRLLPPAPTISHIFMGGDERMAVMRVSFGNTAYAS